MGDNDIDTSQASSPPESGQEGEKHPLQIEIDRLTDFVVETYPDELREGTMVENAIGIISRLRTRDAEWEEVHAKMEVNLDAANEAIRLAGEADLAAGRPFVEGEIIDNDDGEYARDQLAAAVMTGMMAGEAAIVGSSSSLQNERKNIARSAYLMADAMLEVRENG